MPNRRRALARAVRRAVSLSLVASLAVPAQPPLRLTLRQAVELALKQGLQADAAASAYAAASQRDRAAGARLLPQLSLTGSVPAYNRSIVPVTQPDGSTLFRPQQDTRADLNLSLSQRVPYTGTTLTVTSRLAQVQKSGVADQWNSTPLSVGLVQPILRPNNIGWDTREQDVRYELAQRQYREAREDIAVQVTTAFFDYFAAQTAVRNAITNTATNDTLYNLNQGRYEVGKIGENDLLQSELALLRARTILDGARLEKERTLAALRLALNVPPSTPIEIDAFGELPRFLPDTLVAVEQALKNRATMTDVELQDVQARRRISDAKFGTGPGATLIASYGWNASGNERDMVYRDLQNAQAVSLAVAMPIFTWGARSADVQAAMADRQRTTSTGRASREQTVQEAHFAALQFMQAGRQLQLSAKADTVAQKRFDVAYNRYVIGKIFINDLFVAQNEKDQALLQYVTALRNYWLAYYRLRRSTLYDFEEGKAIR
jgi:outer membrane protein